MDEILELEHLVDTWESTASCLKALGSSEDNSVLVSLMNRGRELASCAEQLKDITEKVKKNLELMESNVLLLRNALIGLVGSGDKEELAGMKAQTMTFVSMGSVPAKEARNMVAAIDAILATAE